MSAKVHSLDDSRELRRVRDALSHEFDESAEEHGAFLQALAIIELLVKWCTPKQLERVCHWFRSMCAEMSILVDERPFSALEIVHPTIEPPREVIEQAKQVVERAIVKVSAQSDLIIPVLIERLAETTQELGGEHAPDLARWIFHRLRRRSEGGKS